MLKFAPAWVIITSAAGLGAKRRLASTTGRIAVISPPNKPIYRSASLVVLPLLLATIVTACGSTKADKAENSKSSGHVVHDLLQTGESAFRRGDVKLADKCFNEALTAAMQADRYGRNVALALNDLALTTSIDKDRSPAGKKNLPQAIAYQKRALDLEERLSGAESLDVAYDLNNLGVWYGTNEQWKEGGEALARAAKIREKKLGEKSVLLAVTLGNLAENYSHQKRYDEAISLYNRAATIYENDGSPTEAARAHDKEAGLYLDQGKTAPAVKVLRQVLALREKAFGKDNILVAETLNNIAVTEMTAGHNAVAEPLFDRAYKIVKKQSDREIIDSVKMGYRKCLQNMGKNAEAEKLGREI